MLQPHEHTSLAHSMFLMALDETIAERSNDVDVVYLGQMLKHLYNLTAEDPQVRAWLDAWVEGVFHRREQVAS